MNDKYKFGERAKSVAQSLGRVLAGLAVFTAAWDATAQVQQAWVARYPNASPSALQADDQGNLYVQAPTATVKYDANGNQVSVGPGGQTVDNAGNVFAAAPGHPTHSKACGYGHCFDVSYLDFVTTKYNSNGGVQWAAYYDGSGPNSDDFPYLVSVDRAGAVYVGGRSSGVNYTVERNCDRETGFCEWFLVSITTSSASAIVKYDPSGQQVWAARAPGSGSLSAMVVDGSGSVYILNYSQTLKFGPNGHQLWGATYPAINGCGYPTSIAVDRAGNVYVTGFSCQDLGTNGGLFANYLTIKYDPDGNQLWQTLPGGPKTFVDYTFPPMLAVDAAGALYVARINGFRTYKYDTNGSRLWIADTGWGAVLALDGAGNLYSAGQSVSFPNGSYQTSKYDPNGVRLWTTYLGASGDDLPTAIAANNFGNVWVTGRSRRSDGGYDTLTVKYIQSQGPPPLAPRLESPAALPTGQFRFNVVGEAGRFYRIEASSDLVNWFAVTNFVSVTGSNTITDYGTTRSNQLTRAFYRAVTP